MPPAACCEALMAPSCGERGTVESQLGMPIANAQGKKRRTKKAEEEDGQGILGTDFSLHDVKQGESWGGECSTLAAFSAKVRRSA